MKKLNRRNFLKTTTQTIVGLAGFPYLIPSSALGKAGTVAPSNRIVMGCIGLGGQGTFNMLAFAAPADVQIVALCDLNKGSDLYDQLYQFPGHNSAGLAPALERLKTYYASKTPSEANKGIDTYTDFRELLTRDDIDAVTVCTPDHWHGLVSIAAAKAGKDIYCEKPLVNTIEEGKAVCKTVERYGRILQTGSHERSNDSVRFACELIRNGRIGKLHTIRVNMPDKDRHHKRIRQTPADQPVMPIPEGFNYDMWLGSTPKVPYTQKRCHFWWRFLTEYGGGEMTDRGAHIIDLAQLANASDDSGPVEITAKGKIPKNCFYNTFMSYKFDCKYANGVRMIGSDEGVRGIKFEGTEGSIFIHIHGGRLSANPASLLKETIGPNEIHLGRSAGHHRNFIDSVKTRAQPFAPAMVGHRTATICHLLNIAMHVKKTLKWDPVAEQITNNHEANSMLSRPMRSPWLL